MWYTFVWRVLNVCVQLYILCMCMCMCAIVYFVCACVLYLSLSSCLRCVNTSCEASTSAATDLQKAAWICVKRLCYVCVDVCSCGICVVEESYARVGSCVCICMWYMWYLCHNCAYRHRRRTTEEKLSSCHLRKTTSEKTRESVCVRERDRETEMEIE